MAKLKTPKQVEEFALDKKERLVTEPAVCIGATSACRMHFGRSKPAGEELGWVEERGGEGRERSDGIKCTAKEGIHQAERARDRHAPSATIHVRKRERESEKKRDKKGR